MRNIIILILSIFTLSLVSCETMSNGKHRMKGERGKKHDRGRGGKHEGKKGKRETVSSVCNGKSDLSKVPDNYLSAMIKYTKLNQEYLIYVCTEDSDGDGKPEFIVVESTGRPEHKSVYYDSSNKYYEDYDYTTNIHKFAAVYEDQTPRRAGRNTIEEQTLILKMPIQPTAAANKTKTDFGAMGIALNGVSLFNENAAPGDEITDELFTFDQCSGHPENRGTYHYHVDPVCLIQKLGGKVNEVSKTDSGTTYNWLEDSGDNAGLLLGFLMDGFPVYGPIGNGEKDCKANAVPAIDEYNGHLHCTADFSSGSYHYHVKTATQGGKNDPVFWITNNYFYGEPGLIGQ